MNDAAEAMRIERVAELVKAVHDYQRFNLISEKVSGLIACLSPDRRRQAIEILVTAEAGLYRLALDEARA